MFNKPVVFALHGSGTDTIQDLAADSDGNLYIAATTNSPDLPVKNGAQPATGNDAFVAKVSPNGEVMWSTHLGGDGPDAAKFLAVDVAGNVYVAGTTFSTDFPLTGERLGTRGNYSDAFLAKFDSAGNLVYSTVLGGIRDVGGLAVDRHGNAHLVGAADPYGRLNAPNLPVTPDAFQTAFGDEFVAKFGPDGAPVYISYLGDQQGGITGAIAIDPQGAAVVGGSTGRLVRIEPAGRRLTYSGYVGGAPEDAGLGPTVMQVDADGNVYVAGITARPDFAVTDGAYSSVLRSANYCGATAAYLPGLHGGDLFVIKLRAGDLAPVYSALLAGECPSEPQRLLLDSGVVTVTGRTVANAYPLRSPEVGPVCGGLLSRLGPEGSLEYSSRLCGGPGVAIAPDGGLYVASSGSPAAVLLLERREPGAVSLDRVANAFSGSATVVAPATLVTLSGSGLGPYPPISLDWNRPDALPLELGGTQVLFDSQPARLLYVSQDRILCVTPADLADRAVAQVIYGGEQSNRMGVGVTPANPGLLSRAYPDVGLAPETTPDGLVLNEDGTWNDAAHPAPIYSTVTLFVTGLGAIDPPLDPGAPAPGSAVRPMRNSVWWNLPFGGAPVEVFTVPGLIATISQVRVKVPGPASVHPPGYPMAPGTHRLPLSLITNSRLGPTTRGIHIQFIPFSDWSNSVAIYVLNPW